MSDDKFLCEVGLMELETSLARVGSSEVFNSGISELFSQKSTLLIPPQSIVIELRVDGRVCRVGIDQAFVFGWQAWIFPRRQFEYSEAKPLVGVGDVVF